MNGQTEYRSHFFFSRPCSTAEKPSSDTIPFKYRWKGKKKGGAKITLKNDTQKWLIKLRKRQIYPRNNECDERKAGYLYLKFPIVFRQNKGVIFRDTQTLALLKAFNLADNAVTQHVPPSVSF